MSWAASAFRTIAKLWTPQLETVRYRYHATKVAKGPLLRRYGYKEPIDMKGLLPRPDSGRRIQEMPIYLPKNAWSEKKALFGQNDYIDVLGSGNIHPTRILYNVPTWLRGVKGNEFQLLVRKHKIFKHGIYPIAKPKKWYDLKKRMIYLYKYLNQETRTWYSRR